MKESKKNILVVTTTFPRWPGDSSSSVVFDLSTRLAKNFNIVVLAPHAWGAEKKERWSNLLIYRFRYFWPTQYQKVCYDGGILSNIKGNRFLIFVLPFLFISQFLKIIYLIKKEKIDLIHAHWFLPSGLIAGLISKICQKPLIITAHGSDILVLRGKIWQRIKKIIVNLADLITVLSPEIAQELTKIQTIKPKKIFVIPMGVETFFFTPYPKPEKGDKIIEDLDRPILLYVGRLSQAKGINYLIKALPMIAKKFPGVSLVVIGSGQQKKELEFLVSNSSLKDKVFFLGGLANKKLPYYYNQADVFILPSLSEGTPVTVLEAMSSGCPVVVTKVGGLLSLMENEKNGLLVNCRSSKEISQAVIRILSDANLRNRIIKEARKIIEKKYDWQLIANRFKNIYKICLNNGKK